MADSTEKKTVMVRYILGQVSPEERAGLEERYFADGDLFEELLAAENDLIDSYVRGKLTGSERFQFEGRFLATPELRERVKMARTLAGYGSDVSSKSPVPGNLVSPAWRLAFSAAVVVLLAWASWMTVSNIRLRRQIEQMNVERANLQQQQQEAQRQIADLNARIQQSQAHHPTPEIAQLGPPGQSIVSLTLEPGIQRSGGKANVLPISSDLPGVLLLLKTGRGLYSSYSLSLETPEGRQVLKRAGLKALLAQSGEVVSVALPSSALQRGDYILRLFGNNSGGQTEEIAAYSFRVVLH